MNFSWNLLYFLCFWNILNKGLLLFTFLSRISSSGISCLNEVPEITFSYRKSEYFAATKGHELPCFLNHFIHRAHVESVGISYFLFNWGSWTFFSSTFVQQIVHGHRLFSRGSFMQSMMPSCYAKQYLFGESVDY